MERFQGFGGHHERGYMDTITKDMTISEVVRMYPDVMHVLEGYGMGCSYCMASLEETIEGGARMHGVSLDLLLGTLNQALLNHLEKS